MTIIVLHGFADASKLEAAAMYTVPFHASVAHNSPTGRNENLDRKGGGGGLRGRGPKCKSLLQNTYSTAMRKEDH